MEKLIRQIKSCAKTWLFFGLACCFIPVFTISYICIYVKNKFWVSCLSLKYPGYEISTSKKIRTLIDTARNAGIFHFLLQVKGPCDFEKIKEHYLNHVVEKRTKTRNLCFPKLRRKLVSCWGHYAWVKDDSDFDVNNHIIQSAKNYRGRMISESNIQDVVSDLVAKYIPADIPPWQVIVIPAVSAISSTASESEQSEKESFYILVRLHHLLMAEEKNLHISEILMLNSETSTFDDIVDSPAPLNVVKKPIHIPKLWNHIIMTVVNRWNEFIYRYDPLESPDVEKKQQINCLSQLASIFFITIITVVIDFIKSYQRTNNHIKYKMKFLVNLFRREAYKRNLNIQAIIDSILVSFNPINIFKNIIKILLWILIMTIFLSPYYFCREIMAFKDVLFTGHTTLSNTYIGLLSVYIPLTINATKEVIYIMIEIIRAPRNIYEELFQSKSKEGNILQIKSYSGRKVVSFSKSIDMTDVRKRINTDELGEIEFILSCLAGSLQNYLLNFKDHRVPTLLNTTCRSISKGYFLEKYSKTAHIGGVIFLQLPLQEPNRSQATEVHQIIERVRQKQIAIYLLSVAQTNFEILTSIIPEVWMKIFINYFSISFPVTITDIHGDSSEMETIWGQKVIDMLLFRPPQSKTCLSLNIHRFGDKSRLAVMADTQLAPDHSLISNFWETSMETTIL